MKAEINRGILEIQPENGTEKYAIEKYILEHFALSHERIIVTDKFMSVSESTCGALKGKGLAL